MFTVVVTCITITPIVMEAKPKLKNNNTNKLDNIILLWRRRRGKRGRRGERCEQSRNVGSGSEV